MLYSLQKIFELFCTPKKTSALKMFPIGPFWVNNYVQIANFWLGATLLHYTAADENYQRWERERERILVVKPRIRNTSLSSLSFKSIKQFQDFVSEKVQFLPSTFHTTHRIVLTSHHRIIILSWIYKIVLAENFSPQKYI